MNDHVFRLEGEDLSVEPHAYEVCGLQGVYLLNGFEKEMFEGEEYVSVKNVDGLHKAIGRHLVLTRKMLSPAEIRFLRKTLGLTQAELAAKLGCNVQSVARWEKAVHGIPGSAEKLLRVLTLAETCAEPEDFRILQQLVVSILDELDRMDDVVPAQARFCFGTGWEEVPRKAA